MSNLCGQEFESDLSYTTFDEMIKIPPSEGGLSIRIDDRGGGLK